ncbi:DMT family transporter [Boseongicola aestuarii]|uniref:Putative DMT superfamily transporter inner membrane protein n=1 Tax=Boseongicola aestuarii TaxID=1470561 RepID=A0A238IYP1_9RHOB|nr:DMT family transporter [Boseongicola aestuarii]SMX23516.1 putative DMT superfamily transporter inner membrane protein [Boseongicola aestuarii]
MSERVFLIVCLVAMGAGWGSTQPLAKIAVSEGYRHIGLVFWQLAIGAMVMGVIQTLRGRPLTLSRPALRIYVIIAMIGTILPNSASYEAARHLPAGVVSILLSLVPLFAFPFAIVMGNERFQWVRFGGLALGLFGVLLIVAPEASLPERAAIVFIPLALIAPLFYGLEGNVVARWGTAGLEPVEVLYGASVVGAMIALPIALASGQFIDPRGPWGRPDFALMLSSAIHVLVYSAYVWMVGRAGPVFAVQVSYLVTGFGVGWAMLILDESYSVWVWGAMGVILTGVFLVQPSPRAALVELDERGKS